MAELIEGAEVLGLDEGLEALEQVGESILGEAVAKKVEEQEAKPKPKIIIKSKVKVAKPADEEGEEVDEREEVEREAKARKLKEREDKKEADEKAKEEARAKKKKEREEQEKARKKRGRTFGIKYPKTITAYWRARDKHPDFFPLLPDGQPGTMLKFDSDGKATGIIEEGPPVKIPELTLQLYTGIGHEAIDTLWANRQEAFEPVYESIEKAKQTLREALDSFKTGAGTAREVVIANQLVADEEAKLISIRSAKRWTELLENPTTNTIDLQNRYEVRKLGFDVYQLKEVAISNTELVRVMTPEEASGVSASKGGAQEFVYGVVTDDSLLGLHWPAEFMVGNTNYFTAFQAILGEVARQKDQKLMAEILKTRSSRTMRLLTKEFQAEDFTPKIFESVITALSKKFPEFRELLLKTGDEYLVYANIEDTLFSIGLEKDDPNLQDSKKWRGQNLWGQALQEARMEFREKNVTIKPEEEAESIEAKKVENSVISVEQQQAAKKAAIINARRFHKNH